MGTEKFVTNVYVNEMLGREEGNKIKKYLQNRLIEGEVPFKILVDNQTLQYKIFTSLLETTPLYVYENIESYMRVRNFKGVHQEKNSLESVKLSFEDIRFKFTDRSSGNSVDLSFKDITKNDPNGHSYVATGEVSFGGGVSGTVYRRLGTQLGLYFSGRSFNLGRDAELFKRIIEGVIYKHAVGEFTYSGFEINFLEVDNYLKSVR